MNIHLYVEGGGNSRSLRRECRKGFRTFIEKAGLGEMMPRIVASGTRKRALEEFVTAHQSGNAMLLVDAERPVETPGAWQHFRQAPDEWSSPENATDEQCHLMVQSMESWFLADRDALMEFFGQGYRDSAPPRNPRIEQIAKDYVLNHPRNATRDTRKGTYAKGAHSYEILAKTAPEKVMEASPHARRFIDILRKWAQG